MNFTFILLIFFSINVEAKNGFNIQGSLIPQGEILKGGPPKDGIPSIDKPKFFNFQKALKALPADSRAIVISKGIHMKAYPIPILNWHEVVNDRIGNIPVVVSYCPLCGTGMVFRSTVNKKDKLKFGVSGLLYNSDMLLYDRQSDSLWSQIKRLGVTGKYKATKLRVYPSKIVNLFEHIKKHPHTKILSTDTGYTRDYKKAPYGNYSSSASLYFPVKNLDKSVHIKTWSLLVERGNKRMIFPIKNFKNSSGKLNIKIGGRKTTIVYDKVKNLINCEFAKRSFVCMTGYYFALKSFYPDAKVYK